MPGVACVVLARLIHVASLVCFVASLTSSRGLPRSRALAHVPTRRSPDTASQLPAFKLVLRQLSVHKEQRPDDHYIATRLFAALDRDDSGAAPTRDPRPKP